MQAQSVPAQIGFSYLLREDDGSCMSVWFSHSELTPVVELTPEQRMMQRIIPFFQLPGCETLPSTANVKPRVDTHNTT